MVTDDKKSVISNSLFGHALSAIELYVESNHPEAASFEQ